MKKTTFFVAFIFTFLIFACNIKTEKDEIDEKSEPSENPIIKKNNDLKKADCDIVDFQDHLKVGLNMEELLEHSKETGYEIENNQCVHVRQLMVAYFNMMPEEIELFASKFEVLVTDFARLAQVEQVKAIEPGLIALGYRDAMGMYDTYQDWEEVNQHEEWFVHDAFGHRIRQDAYCWYLMDVGHAGYRAHYGAKVVESMEDTPFDGVFADDVLASIKVNRSYANVRLEESVVGSNGFDVSTMYSIWNPSTGRCTNEIHVYDNPLGEGIDYFLGGSSAENLRLGVLGD